MMTYRRDPLAHTASLEADVDELVAFLLARLDEREAVARAAAENQPGFTASQGFLPYWDVTEGQDYGDNGIAVWAVATHAELDTVEDVDWHSRTPAAKHIALNDPVYVLADVEAKRRIVDDYRVPTLDDMQTDDDTPPPRWVIKLLALPFA